MALTKLKLVILRRGLTQKQVARKAGIHESTLSMIATGKCLPDQKQRELIAGAVESKPTDIFDEK